MNLYFTFLFMAEKDTKGKAEKTAYGEYTEEFTLSGDKVVQKVRDIIKGGKARRIIIKNDKGNPVMEIPLMVSVVGTLLAPYLTAVGALAAVLANCTIVVVKNKNGKVKKA